MSIKRMIVVGVFGTLLCPIGIGWVSLHTWRENEAERARNVARSEARAEHKTYISDFVEGLTRPSEIQQPFAVRLPAGQRHGEKLAGYFREQLQEVDEGSADQTKRIYLSPQEALCEYLDTPEAREQAVAIGIPVAVLPIVAEKLRPSFVCGSVAYRERYQNRK